MKFRLEFDMDNAAFQDALGNWEIANVLHRLAGQVQSDNRSVSRLDGWSWLLRDSNGNRIGEAGVTEEVPAREGVDLATGWVKVARRDIAEANDPPETRVAKLEERIFGEDFVRRDLLDGKGQ